MRLKGLARNSLEATDEPDLERILPMLPPLVGYTFVGDPDSKLKAIVEPDGKIGPPPEPSFDPTRYLDLPEPPTEVKHDLVDDLPIPRLLFLDREGELIFEEIALVEGEDLFVMLRSVEKGSVALKLLPSFSHISPDEFEAALGRVRDRWENLFDEAMRLEIPDPLLKRACRVAIARALSACIGPHPKYGVRRYAEGRHDSFPPATLSLVLCLLEWGLFDEAKRRLTYYLDRFVNSDGSFDYYGPAISEYGQMLSLATRVYRLTRDGRWLRDVLPELERIAAFLLRWPERDENGLLTGPAEADTFETHRMSFFSGNLWSVRGLLDLARILADSNPDQAKEIERFACQLLEKTLQIIRRSVDESVTPPFVPPAPGVKPFERMTQDTFASYTNYRYWPEMLSSGLLPPEICDYILDYRALHGGELLGMTRFMDWLDDWPLAHLAFGLLLRGRRRKFLTALYAHLVHHQAVGTLTAYEQVSIEADAHRKPMADFCLPSQLVVPIMVKWAIVFEMVPRKWLEEGFSAIGVPTESGIVDISASNADGGLTRGSSGI